MLKTIPILKPKEPEGVSLNKLKSGVIFLHEGALYIKDKNNCGGTDLLTGLYNDEKDDATVIEVDATLNWQKKKTKTTPKKKKKKS